MSSSTKESAENRSQPAKVSENDSKESNDQMSFKDWKTFKAALTKSETEKSSSSSSSKKISEKKNDKRSDARFTEGNSNKFGNGYNSNRGMGWNRGNCNYSPGGFIPPLCPGPNPFDLNPLNNAFGMNFSDNFSNTFNNPVYNNFNPDTNNPFPNNFFSKDGMYRQRDNMQKPLNHYNPFRNTAIGDRVLDNLNKASSSKPQKGKGGVKRNVKPKQQQSGHHQSTGGVPKRKENTIKTVDPALNSDQQKLTPPPPPPPSLISEPKIFVKNPKPNPSKPYIPLPRLPDENSELTPEERKKQWKEYREAMKPFKNREFYNAKRVVQRLGKKDPNELEEKEKLRLAKAQETMAAHKLRLSQKYAPYVKSADPQPNAQMGEVYVLKQRTLKYWNSLKPIPEHYNNYGNFGENIAKPITTLDSNATISTISTTYDHFPTFVSGGVMEGTIQTLPHQN